jgi:hypothetical protein
MTISTLLIISAIRRLFIKNEYLICWEGYDESPDQWVKEEDIDGGLVDEYMAKVEQEG